MRLSHQLGRPLAAVLIASVPVAAGCGIGKGNETDKERQTPYAAGATAGDMKIRNVYVTPASGAGPATPSAPAGTPSATPDGFVVLTIVNSGDTPDTVTNVTASQGTVSLSNGSGTVSGTTVQGHQVLQFVDPNVGSNGPTLVLSGLDAPLQEGGSVTLTVSFETAGNAQIVAPVKVQTGTTASSTPLATTGSYPGETSASVPESASPETSQSSTP